MKPHSRELFDYAAHEVGDVPVKEKKFSGSTSTDKDHSHRFTVDDDGNGETSTDHEHKHEIEKWKILEANGHRHSIAKPAPETKQMEEIIECLDLEEIEKGIRPAFGSPGGKRNIAHATIRYFPDHKIYIEPFIGGGAILFAKDPSEKEVINDLDPQIANAWKTIKSANPDHIRESSSSRNWVSSEERIRSAWKNRDEGVSGFLTFLYGIRGSFSSNRRTISRTAIGTSLEPAFKNLEAIYERLKGVTITQHDYKKLKCHDSPETFFYLDPPYPGEWAKETAQDRFDLESFINFLKALRSKWLVSINIENQKYFVGKGWHFARLERITTFTRPDQRKDPEHRDYDIELLVSNYPLKKSDQWIAKINNDDLAPVNSSSDSEKLGDSVTLEEVQGWFDKPAILVKGVTALVGSLATAGKTERDVDHLIRIPSREELIRRITFRLDRMMPSVELRERQHVLDDASGPFTDHVLTYDLILVPTGEKNVVRMKLEDAFPDLVEKQARQLLMAVPDETKKYAYVWGHHYRGKTCHVDFRIEGEGKDFLIGWTIADLIPGVIDEPVEAIADARKWDKTDRTWKIDYKTGKFKSRETRAGTIVPAQLRAFQKAPEPHAWLDVEGVTPESTEEKIPPGATRQHRGVFTIIDGTPRFNDAKCEYGAQKQDTHEYFLSGGLIEGRLMIRRLARKTLAKDLDEIRDDLYRINGPLEIEHLEDMFDLDSEILSLEKQQAVLPPGVEEEKPRTDVFWVAIQPIDQTPIVLKKREVDKGWMPPKGASALPKSIRDKVPAKFQYWKASNESSAREIRRDLVKAIADSEVDLNIKQ